MSDGTIILITQPDGKVLKVFNVPTAQIHDRDRIDLAELATKFNQRIEFHVVGFTGIEAMKWDLREMNGDT